jgi:hypothetical protein
MKNTSTRLKEDKLKDKRSRYRDYDKNTREFLKIKKELSKNGVKKPK